MGGQIQRYTVISFLQSIARAEGKRGAFGKQRLTLSLRQATPLKQVALRGWRKDYRGGADACGQARKRAQTHLHPRHLCATPPFSSTAQWGGKNPDLKLLTTGV